MDPERIPVAIIDAGDVGRGGLEILFLDDEARFELVRSVSRPAALPPTEDVFVLVIDPAPSGSMEEAWLWEARSRAPNALLVVCTQIFDAGALRVGLDAGISAYLLMGRPSGEAIRDVEYLIARFPLVVVDESIRDFFAADPRRLRLGPMPGLPRPLTRSEREVLQLLAHGLHDGEIAERRGTSVDTARAQIHSIERKLGARQRTELGLLAVRYALIDPDAL
jgi:DNA-binding NarL/FixJ family response regulator